MTLPSAAVCVLGTSWVAFFPTIVRWSSFFTTLVRIDLMVVSICYSLLFFSGVCRLELTVCDFFYKVKALLNIVEHDANHGEALCVDDSSPFSISPNKSTCST